VKNCKGIQLQPFEEKAPYPRIGLYAVFVIKQTDITAIDMKQYELFRAKFKDLIIITFLPESSSINPTIDCGITE